MDTMPATIPPIAGKIRSAKKALALQSHQHELGL